MGPASNSHLRQPRGVSWVAAVKARALGICINFFLGILMTWREAGGGHRDGTYQPWSLEIISVYPQTFVKLGFYPSD